MTKAYEEGYAAYGAGAELTSNPYIYDAYWEWDAGWKAAAEDAGLPYCISDYAPDHYT